MNTEHYIFTSWLCPHCSRHNRITVDITRNTNYNPLVATCDPEHGGCDKDSVLYPTLHLNFRIAPIGA